MVVNYDKYITIINETFSVFLYFDIILLIQIAKETIIYSVTSKATSLNIILSVALNKSEIKEIYNAVNGLQQKQNFDNQVEWQGKLFIKFLIMRQYCGQLTILLCQ